MKQLYQDTIALSTKFGCPDLFTTFTCNPNWKEIKENLLPGKQSINCPDLIARVFRLKLKALMKDILKRKVLGKPYHQYIPRRSVFGGHVSQAVGGGGKFVPKGASGTVQPLIMS